MQNQFDVSGQLLQRQEVIDLCPPVDRRAGWLGTPLATVSV